MRTETGGLHGVLKIASGARVIGCLGWLGKWS